MLTNESQVTKRLLHCNVTHLSMSGYSPFAWGSLATEIGHDGEGDDVDEMLKGTYTLDTYRLYDEHASSK